MPKCLASSYFENYLLLQAFYTEMVLFHFSTNHVVRKQNKTKNAKSEN